LPTRKNTCETLMGVEDQERPARSGSLGFSLASRQVTVMRALPLTPPALACRMTLPVRLPGAVYTPLPSTLPSVPPSSQANVGWVARSWPNWSRATAVNDCWVPRATETGLGLTWMDFSVWLTVTLTWLVMLAPNTSVMVTWNR